MATLIETMEVPTEQEMEVVKNIERDCNNLAKISVKLLNMGGGIGHGSRINGNVTRHYSRAAPLYGLRKDHKVLEPGQEPPLRPVCGAITGPNASFSSLLAEFISYINLAENDPHQCGSTEEMMASITQVNERGRGINEDVSLFLM